MPKISDLPADTAPASTDLIPFVDVDAARTESVTVANLAASAAFSGQYAPSTVHLLGTLAARPAAASTNAGWLYVASDVNGGTLYRSNGSSWVQVAASVQADTTESIWIPAQSFFAPFATVPNLSYVGASTARSAAWMMDGAATETISTTRKFPSTWTNVNVDIWWSHNIASPVATGVRFTFNRMFLDAATSINSSASTRTVDDTMPTQYFPKATRVVTDEAVVSGITRFWIQRNGGHANDTNTDDIGILGVEVTKTS